MKAPEQPSALPSGRRGTDVLPGQIPTQPYIIILELFECGPKTIDALVRCLLCEPGSYAQKNCTIVAASYWERAAGLVYWADDGSVRKPALAKYYDLVFDTWAATPDALYRTAADRGVTREQADLVCPMMACADEQLSVADYAYAIEYVLRHNGDLPKPDIRHVFPLNYPDYDRTKGIAEEVEQYRGK